MDFHLIAEGVETERQMSTLISMGVDAQQGYLLARPLPVNEIGEWLAKLPSTERSNASSHMKELQALAMALDFQITSGFDAALEEAGKDRNGPTSD